MMETEDAAKTPGRATRRRRLAAKVPQFDLDNCHTENCRVLADRQELLKRLPRHGVAAEIGAAFGDFTAEILKLAAPSKLHLIDAWDTERYRQGMETIKEKLPAEIAAEKVVLNQGYSTDILAQFDDDYFDWVYIDTNHSYRTTYQELLLSARKVKPDGLIAGHDFCTGNAAKALPYGVVEACAEFCVKFGWQHRYLALDPGGHFSFCLARM